MHRMKILIIPLLLAIATACSSTDSGALSPASDLVLQQAERSLDAGDLTTALVKLRQLRSMNLHQGPKEDLVRSLQLSARLFTALGDIQALHDVTLQLLHHTPDDAQLLTWLGLHELRHGQFQAAQEYLEQALALDPRQWQALNGLGVLADVHKDFESAERLFERALLVLPGHPDVLANLGWSKVLSGNYPEAESWLRQSIAVAPDAPTTQSNLAFCMALQGRYEEALRLYQTMYDEAIAINNVGYAAAKRGDAESAERFFTSALEVKPVFYGKAANNLARLQSLRHSVGP